MRHKLLLRNVLLSCCLAPCLSAADPNVRLVVDTQSRNLEIIKGEEVLDVLEHVVIGRKGAGTKEHRGDDITPLGEYRIGWINDKSSFRKFFGLTYPNIEHAEKALKRGQIGPNTYDRIAQAQLKGQIPPQNTDLGGQIGIHGLGSGSLIVHEEFDWTHGCIALTNEQIDLLSRWVEKGTHVTVK